jgi:hydrogenase expression/formation protein HypE
VHVWFLKRVPATRIIDMKGDDKISINHGSGYKLTRDLIETEFLKVFGIPEPLTDSAVMQVGDSILSFTTDSYVVDPLFFPGGDIGKLSVCGTVNDLAVSGATPEYISAAFIIEEGFPLNDLRVIIRSMAAEAEKAGIRIVTGDTKVVGKGKCDGMFITTSGVGILPSGHKEIGSGRLIEPGDKLIVNGPVGNHSVAVLGARNNLNFSSEVVSDCASLNRLIKSILIGSDQIHFMRDLTRGGLAVVLNELASMADVSIEVDEAVIPVDDPVKGLCEILGFDPLYLANEGKILVVAGKDSYINILEVMKSFPEGKGAAVIGEVTGDAGSSVTLNTIVGGKRLLSVPSGLQLPRIC